MISIVGVTIAAPSRNNGTNKHPLVGSMYSKRNIIAELRKRHIGIRTISLAPSRLLGMRLDLYSDFMKLVSLLAETTFSSKDVLPGVEVAKIILPSPKVLNAVRFRSVLGDHEALRDTIRTCCNRVNRTIDLRTMDIIDRRHFTS